MSVTPRAPSRIQSRWWLLNYQDREFKPAAFAQPGDAVRPTAFCSDLSVVQAENGCLAIAPTVVKDTAGGDTNVLVVQL